MDIFYILPLGKLWEGYGTYIRTYKPRARMDMDDAQHERNRRWASQFVGLPASSGPGLGAAEAEILVVGMAVNPHVVRLPLFSSSRWFGPGAYEAQ